MHKFICLPTKFVSFFLDPKEVKLYCCKEPANLIPCESETYFDEPSIVGLESVHPSSKLNSDSFNNYKTNHFLMKLIESMQNAAKPHNFDFNTFNFTERPAPMDQGYQLVVKCGGFTIRTDTYKKIAGTCREMKETNVADCKCIETVSKSKCSFYYETYAVSTFENLLVKGDSYIYKVIDKHAKGKWIVGLFNPNETKNSTSTLELSNEAGSEIQSVLCSYLGNTGLKKYSIARKQMTGVFEIVMIPNTSIFHF